jgi:hypothetical protein
MTQNKIQFVIEIDEHGQPVIRSVEKDFDKLNKTTKKTSRTFKAAKAAWASMTAALGVYTLVQVAKGVLDLANAASDMNETLSKSSLIFGEQEKAMEAWASTSAESMGLATQAALEHAATMGNMFSQLGAGSGTAAEVSRNMVQLSADIASLHNVAGGASEVLLGMQSAFRGEYDALQRYIPTINAAAVQEQALAMTHKARAAELTNLEKAMAAVEIITRDAGAATGDFARTAEGAANQERILAANIADLKAKFGERLLPVVGEVISEINAFMDSLSADEINYYAGAVGGLAHAFIELSLAVPQVAEWLHVNPRTEIGYWREWDTAVLNILDVIGGKRDWMSGQLKGLSADLNNLRIAAGQTTGQMAGIPSGGIKPAPEEAMPADLAAKIEEETAAFEAAKMQRTELEIFMEAERIGALHDMELGHRQWEMDQLTASSEYKMAAMQSEHDWAVEALQMRNEEMVAAELDFQNRMTAIDQQSAAYKQQIAIGLGTALLSAAGASAKKIFAVTQGFQIALAIMSAHAAAAKALAEVPYPFNLAVSAKMMTMGYLQAAAIAATTIGQLAVGSGGGGGAAVNAPGETGYRSSVSAPEALTNEAEKKAEPYAQKWDVTIVNPIGNTDWVENTLVPELRKVAKRDTEITVRY